MNGYPLAIHVKSKKLVAYFYCLFIPSDLPINEPVFRKINQKEEVSLLLLLSGRMFYRWAMFLSETLYRLVTVFAKARVAQCYLFQANIVCNT